MAGFLHLIRQTKHRCGQALCDGKAAQQTHNQHQQRRRAQRVFRGAGSFVEHLLLHHAQQHPFLFVIGRVTAVNGNGSCIHIVFLTVDAASGSVAMGADDGTRLDLLAAQLCAADEDLPYLDAAVLFSFHLRKGVGALVAQHQLLMGQQLGKIFLPQLHAQHAVHCAVIQHQRLGIGGKMLRLIFVPAGRGKGPIAKAGGIFHPLCLIRRLKGLIQKVVMGRILLRIKHE